VVFSDPGVLLLRTVSKEQLENNIMTENVENLSKQVAELTSKLSTLQISSEKTAADLKAANDKIAELTKAGETAKNEFNELKTKYEGEVTKATELKKVADEVTKARDEANAELAKVRAAELKAKRVSKLVEAGIAKDEAEKKVEAFASLNDEQFTVVADALIAAAKSKSAEADIDVDPADKSVEADASKAVDKTKASDANVVAPADEDNKVDNTKASIAKWLNSQLGGENTEK
jgi:chromosome segregation ATPase